MAVWLLIAAVILLDQVTKYLIRSCFAVGETLPVIPNIFHLTYVQNRGAAFSLFQNMPVLTIVFPALAMVACLGLLLWFRRRQERVLPVALGLVLAGGIGNLIDRIGIGFVTDMFDFRVFPVFNVADIAVCCGCGLIAVWLFFIDGKKQAEPAEQVQERAKEI